jgi:hypothetical protein
MIQSQAKPPVSSPYGGLFVDDSTLISVIDTGRIIAAFLVAIGVAGEFAGEYIARPVHHRIESARQAEIAELNRQAREAQKHAAEANERTAQLEKEAEELAASNLRLETAISPRRLSKQQIATLSSLKGFSNRLVAVKSYSNDTEGLVLATQIIEALSKSGVRVQDNRLTLQSAGTIFFGVVVQGADKSLVEELKKTFGDLATASMVSSTEHLGVSGRIEAGVINLGAISATITVGVKPIK